MWHRSVQITKCDQLALDSLLLFVLVWLLTLSAEWMLHQYNRISNWSVLMWPLALAAVTITSARISTRFHEPERKSSSIGLRVYLNQEQKYACGMSCARRSSRCEKNANENSEWKICFNFLINYFLLCASSNIHNYNHKFIHKDAILSHQSEFFSKCIPSSEWIIKWPFSLFVHHISTTNINQSQSLIYVYLYLKLDFQIYN